MPLNWLLRMLQPFSRGRVWPPYHAPLPNECHKYGSASSVWRTGRWCRRLVEARTPSTPAVWEGESIHWLAKLPFYCVYDGSDWYISSIIIIQNNNNNNIYKKVIYIENIITYSMWLWNRVLLFCWKFKWQRMCYVKSDHLNMWSWAGWHLLPSRSGSYGRWRWCCLHQTWCRHHRPGPHRPWRTGWVQTRLPATTQSFLSENNNTTDHSRTINWNIEGVSKKQKVTRPPLDWAFGPHLLLRWRAGQSPPLWIGCWNAARCVWDPRSPCWFPNTHAHTCAPWINVALWEDIQNLCSVHMCKRHFKMLSYWKASSLS